jgi:hypothetical protein
VGDGDGKPGKAPFAILHLSKQSATSCMLAFLARQSCDYKFFLTSK